MKLYNKLSEYNKEKYGFKILKVPVSINTTCPNRDGTKGKNGCIFCSMEGSGENRFSKKPTLSMQLEDFFSSYKAKRADHFIIYFQNFSNTYGSLEYLEQQYIIALQNPHCFGIDIATRPDCINIEILALLKKLEQRYKKQITIELGLQNADDDIGNYINRKYTTKDFIASVNLIQSYGFEVICHVMLGLPKETTKSLEQTITLLNMVHVNGVKFTNTYVLKDTKLYDLFVLGKYVPLEFEEYMEKLIFCLELLDPNIVVCRIKSDPPKDFIAPLWCKSSKKVINSINKYLIQKGSYQGCKYVSNKNKQ